MVSLGIGIGLTAIRRMIRISARVSFPDGFANNELVGTANQHGTLYYMTGTNAVRSPEQIVGAVGAEDSGFVFVDLGNFGFTLDLSNTATYADRWLHLVLENSNGFSNVEAIEFQINDPVGWIIQSDGTIVSWPTFDDTPWDISAPGSTVRILSHPQEII